MYAADVAIAIVFSSSNVAFGRTTHIQFRWFKNHSLARKAHRKFADFATYFVACRKFYDRKRSYISPTYRDRKSQFVLISYIRYVFGIWMAKSKDLMCDWGKKTSLVPAHCSVSRTCRMNFRSQSFIYTSHSLTAKFTSDWVKCVWVLRLWHQVNSTHWEKIA